jgi:hypothetical protein
MTQYIAQWASGIVVRWRALTWGEYRQFKEQILTRPVGVTADIYRAVLLEGPAFDDSPAGVADFVARHVLDGSAFSGDYKTVARALQESRGQLEQRYLLSAKAMIAHLFRYTFEEIDEWDADLFFQRLAQAEFIAGRPLDPAAPQTADTKTKAQPRRPLNKAQAMVLDRARNKAS